MGYGPTLASQKNDLMQGAGSILASDAPVLRWKTEYRSEVSMELQGQGPI